MALLNRDTILKADDLAYEEVEVPEWGGSVRVKTLTGVERDKLEASMVEQKGKHQRINAINFRAKLVALTVVDEEGYNVFAESDVKALSSKNSGALDKVATVASRLAGMSEEDVEELTEGFGDAPSEASTSD